MIAVNKPDSPSPLPAKINRCDLLTFMSQFLADCQACLPIYGLLFSGQCLDGWATCRRCRPSGQITVPLLRIGVAQAVHF